MKKALEDGFRECTLELHPVKTRIVYCKNSNRRRNYPVVTFDFLGFTFRPRCAKNRQGTYFVNFSPGVSTVAGKAMRQQSRRLEVAPSKRYVPGRSISHIQPRNQRLDKLLQVRPVSDPASSERPTRQVGNENVQKVAVPPHQSGPMVGGNSQKATRAISALAVWCTTDGWMMGAR